MVTLAVQTPILRFVPVEEAARATGVPLDELLKRIEAGKILVGIFDDEMRVAMDNGLVEILQDGQDTPVQDDDINARLRQIRREDFAHLEGQPITVGEAARKYGVPKPTLYRWIRRGFIKVLKQQGRRKQLDESTVAYCAKIYQVRKPYGTRAPLFEPDGSPYLLREPELAQLRRLSRQE